MRGEFELKTEVDDLLLGGGFSALYAALRLARLGRKVAIVDQTLEPGGLMRSVVHKRDSTSYSFDIGTHFLLLTGNDDVDAPLCDSVRKEDWLWYEGHLKEGHYYSRQLLRDTGCLDLTTHPRHADILAEFRAAPGKGGEARTLYQRWLSDFGPIATEILRPIAVKHTGKQPEELGPTAMQVFSVPQIKLIEGEEAVRLKRDPATDRRLAYSNRDQGTTETIKAYPRRGGMGLLITGMIDQLHRLGARTYFGSTARPGPAWTAGNALEEVVLKGRHEGQRIGFERLVTGLAPVPLAKSLGFAVPAAPFATRTLGLAHFIASPGDIEVDDLHWITVFEPDLLASRISLYDNYAEEKTGRITVECPLPVDASGSELAERLGKELVKIGLVRDASRLSCLAVDVMPGAFPILLPDWKDGLEKQVRAAYAAIPNLLPFGAAAGTPFGQLALLTAVTKALG